MKKFIFSNTLWGVALTLAVLFFYFSGAGLEPLELKFYDFRTQLNAGAPSKNEIAIIEINDDSISKIGRWPWPRLKIAEMISLLSTDTARPAVIGLNILFSEPEKNTDLELTEMLRKKYADLVAARKIRETTRESEFDKILVETRREMDNDAKLAAEIAAAGNVVLPMYFNTDEAEGKLPEAPVWLKKYSASVSPAFNSSEPLIEGTDMTTPVELLAASAAGVGHVNVFTDSDGTVRKEYPFIPYNKNFYPSFAEELARTYLRLASSEAVVTSGQSFTLGSRKTPLDFASSMLVAFNKGKTSFKYYSFYDVLHGKVVPEAFKGKIVIIGITAQGIGSLYVTPVEKTMPTVEFSANVLENILHGHFIVKPEWAQEAELGLIIFAGLFVTFLLPRLKAGLGAVLAALLLASISGAGVYLFSEKGMWVKTAYPAFLLVAGYIFIVTKRFFTTEKRKELIEVSAIETNKMLGLSFQGQGMLDLSFEKFRNCPIDDTMKDLLYNLALDFERKRQFNKAVAVYGHIATKDPDYKDIKAKTEMLTKASDGAVFGGSIGKTGNDSTMLVAGSSTIPTLGRYEITKELGKGAMGIVYLGRDPKINRTVAIKTLRFEEGTDEKALKEMKDRFFREAQAAGNLSHPNIVKIYDAGEEQDIAYMAMELLKGEDLKKWTAKESLLPLEKALEYIATAADALDYAHKNGVVHRDIKPANIMLLENGEVRVADFGIARIQASSKTATGTVLGTPYYMSPEQIAGKKVDGRADLFSLGVTLYELLTGERPWKGGEAVGTLFFQISSDPYPDPLLAKPDLPKGVLPVIDRALKKNPDERYQTGAEMAADIRRLLNGQAAPPAQTAPKPEIKTPQPAAPAPKAAPAAQTVKAQTAQAAPKPAVPEHRPVTPLTATVKLHPSPPPAAREEQSATAAKIDPQPLGAPPPRFSAAPQPVTAEKPAPAGLSKIELEPPAATLSLSPKKAEELKTAPRPAPAPAQLSEASIQRPMAETLGQAAPPAEQPAAKPQTPPRQTPQAAPQPAPLTSAAPDFEKTLPLIYPEEEKK